MAILSDMIHHCSFTAKISDPAPPLPMPAADLHLPPIAPLNPSPGPIEPHSLEVLQEFEVSFRIFVIKEPGSNVSRALVLPYGKVSGYSNLSPEAVYTLVKQPREATPWTMQIETGRLRRIQPGDMGPPFSGACLKRVSARSAVLHKDGSFATVPGPSLRVSDFKSVDNDLGDVTCQLFCGGAGCVQIKCQFVFSRRFSRAEWNLFNCKRVPQPQSALLDAAAKTGDVLLSAGEGVEAAAHSAILVAVPYFEAKLREEWSGTTAWNLHNKLRLRLPCHVSKEALDAFLKYLYGDTRSLYGIDPWAMPLLQDVLSLADACGVPALCTDIIGLVVVTSLNVNHWLEWLLQEHSTNAEPIRKQVVQVMKGQLQSALQRQDLTVEQLAEISRSLARTEVLSPLPAPS